MPCENKGRKGTGEEGRQAGKKAQKAWRQRKALYGDVIFAQQNKP